MRHMHVPKFKSWRLKALLVMLTMLALTPIGVSAQRIALKTNALEYAIMEPNVAFEARLSQRLSIQLGVAACPITKSIANVRITNFMVEPELRYWFNRPMARHFVALSFGAYDYSLRWKDTHFMGDAVGAGVSYGYALVLNRHWNMEFELGVGLASLRAKKYYEGQIPPEQYNYSKITPAPVRLALNFSYIFK